MEGAEMKYSAGMVSQLFWFTETKMTVGLINQGMTFEDILCKVLNENIYQIKAEDRRKRAFNCILKRINALPENLAKKIDRMDTSSAKILMLIGIMKTDLLFFEFVYEVFREKIKLGEKKLEDKDLNLFFDNKLSQSEIVQKWSDSGIKKLKNCYVKLLAEAGLLSDTKGNREIIPALINYKVADELVKADMEVYLNAVKGV